MNNTLVAKKREYIKSASYERVTVSKVTVISQYTDLVIALTRLGYHPRLIAQSISLPLYYVVGIIKTNQRLLGLVKVAYGYSVPQEHIDRCVKDARNMKIARIKKELAELESAKDLK